MDPFVPDRGTRDGSAHTCLYARSRHPEDDCGTPATWHVQWKPGRESLICDTHMAIVQARWMYTARHLVSPDCAMPNVRWLEDRCAAEGDVQGADAEIADRILAALAEPSP